MPTMAEHRTAYHIKIKLNITQAKTYEYRLTVFLVE